MTKVHLLDHFGFVVYSPKIPVPVPRTIVWGETVYLFSHTSKQGTLNYAETSCYVCPETKPSGIYKKLELDEPT